MRSLILLAPKKASRINERIGLVGLLLLGAVGEARLLVVRALLHAGHRLVLVLGLGGVVRVRPHARHHALAHRLATLHLALLLRGLTLGKDRQAQRKCYERDETVHGGLQKRGRLVSGRGGFY